MEITLNFTKCCTDSALVTVGGGQVCSKGKSSITVSGIGLLRGGWAISLVLSVNGLGKRPDHVNQFMLA